MTLQQAGRVRIRLAHENRPRDGGGGLSFDRVNDLDRLPSLLRHQSRALVPVSDERSFPKRYFLVRRSPTGPASPSGEKALPDTPSRALERSARSRITAIAPLC